MVLDKKGPDAEEQSYYRLLIELLDDMVYTLQSFEPTLDAMGPVLFAAGVLLYVVGRTRKRMRLRRLRATGRHKKYDVDPLFDA